MDGKSNNFDDYFFNSDSYINYTGMGGCYFSSNSENSFKFIKKPDEKPPQFYSPDNMKPIEGTFSSFSGFGEEEIGEEYPVIPDEKEHLEIKNISLKEYVLKYTKYNSFRIFSVIHFTENGTTELFNGLSYQSALKKIKEIGENGRCELSILIDI